MNLATQGCFSQPCRLLLALTTPPTPINDAHPGGLLFHGWQHLKYLKPPLSIEKQIELLRQRGMDIPDREEAAHYLAHLNYYRQAAYWLPFEKSHNTHQFKPNTSFSQVLGMYIFDRELRLLVMDAVERVEVSLRAHFASYLSGKYGTHAHLQAELFFKQSTYDFTLRALKKETNRSGEDCIRHLTRKYDETLPPLWAAVELMSLGQLSTWYNNLNKREDRKAIADFYGMDEKHLRSFFHHLSIVRNLCAHHARLWNREFTFTYKLPTTRPQALIGSLNRKAPRRLYNTLAMLAYLMDVTCIHHHWKQRLFELLKQHSIDAEAIGTPTGFESLAIWKKE